MSMDRQGSTGYGSGHWCVREAHVPRWAGVPPPADCPANPADDPAFAGRFDHPKGHRPAEGCLRVNSAASETGSTRCTGHSFHQKKPPGVPIFGGLGLLGCSVRRGSRVPCVDGRWDQRSDRAESSGVSSQNFVQYGSRTRVHFVEQAGFRPDNPQSAAWGCQDQKAVRLPGHAVFPYHPWE